MKASQRIIKYCAISLAILLIFTIFASIIRIGYELLNSIGVVNTKKDLLSDMVTITNEMDEISSLNIKLNGTNLKIKNGEKFEIKTNNKKITYKNKNGNVTIKENGKTSWFLNNNVGDIIVYLPVELNELEDTNIKAAVGEIAIDNLNTKTLKLSLGVGEVIIERLNVSEETKIDGGTGQININSGQINNVNFNLGVGDTNISTNILGNGKIKTGIGDLNIKSELEETDYTFSINKGLGEIRVNGTTIGSNREIGNGNNYIKISGGIGDISIVTK